MSFTNDIYLVLLGRPADSTAFQIGQSVGASGVGREDFINQIKASQEFQNRFAGLSNAEAVTEMYMTLFNRKPEPEGLDFWVAVMENTSLGIAEIGLDIAIGAQGNDLRVLQNKQIAADVFTNSLNTIVDNQAYTGDVGIQAGMDALSGVNQLTESIPSFAELDAILFQLALVQSIIFLAAAKDGNSGEFDYTAGETIEDAGTPVIGADFYADQHNEFS